jgi:hypothetical protein
MQYQVPQNITMEDRIAGPLTAIQFTIVVIGGLSSFYLITGNFLPSPLNIIIGGGLAFITVVMALGKFNDQPMYRFFRFIILFIITPKVRVWHKVGTDTKLIQQSATKPDSGQQITLKKVSRKDISQLASLLDTRGNKGFVPKVQISTKFNPAEEEKPGH